MSAHDDVCALAQNLARNRGYAVFPCRSAPGKEWDKTPAWPKREGGQGFKDASVDPDRIAWLWRNWGGPLIGIATGAVSGFDVLDLDAKHQDACAWYHTNKPRLTPTQVYRTRSGGMHRYFSHAEGVRNSASRFVKGIDVRGDGGYVICWFAAGLPCLDSAPLAPWPDWLLKLVLPPPPAPSAPPGKRDVPLNPDYAIAGIVRRVANAAEGERNVLLNWGAWRLGSRVLAGELGQAEATALLTEAARAAGVPKPQALRTIASGLKGAGL